MSAQRQKHVYGPVPSRRLGGSLGVDLVPFKTCSYDCIYCQLGHTTCKTIDRKEWVPADAVLAELKQKLEHKPDIITLSGSGEPRNWASGRARWSNSSQAWRRAASSVMSGAEPGCFTWHCRPIHPPRLSGRRVNWLALGSAAGYPGLRMVRSDAGSQAQARPVVHGGVNPRLLMSPP